MTGIFLPQSNLNGENKSEVNLYTCVWTKEGGYNE